MTKPVLYLCSGRSFKTRSPGRKIFSVVNCWRQLGIQVDHLSGADFHHFRQPENNIDEKHRHRTSSTNQSESDQHNNQQTDSDENQRQVDNSANNYGHLAYYRRAAKLRWLSAIVLSLAELKDLIHDWALLRFLQRFRQDCQYALVWERSSRLHCAGLRFARRQGLPFILEWKDNLVSYRFSLLVLYAKHLEKVKIRQADFIVVESEVLKQQLLKTYPKRNGDTIVVAQNAVDVDLFQYSIKERQQRRQTLGLDDSFTLVGYLGSYAFYHDSLRLMKAALLLKHKLINQPEPDEQPELNQSEAKPTNQNKTEQHLNIRFLMVGVGKEYDAVVEFAKTHQLINQSVYFQAPVHQDTVPKVLSALDIAVLPGSTDIICPIKVQEYMGMGLATIAPNYACNREVINTGKDGLLFTPFDEQSLANQIEKLHYEPQLRQQLAAKGAIKMRNKFNWQETWGKALTDILQRLP